MYRVLIVEDEIIERENIRESWIWKDRGFILQADAGNGEEAWEILKHEKIDIVVTDIKMPFRDGLELARQIEEEMPRIKVIILSGFSDFQFAQQALRAGVSDYLLKPIRSEDLLDTLKKAAAKLAEDDLAYNEVSLNRINLRNHHISQRQQLLENLLIGITASEKQLQLAGLQQEDLTFDSVCCAIISYLNDKTMIGENEHCLILEGEHPINDLIDTLDVLVLSRNLRETVLIFRDPNLDDVKKTLAGIKQIIDKEWYVSPLHGQPKISLGRVNQGINGIADSYTDARFLINFQSNHNQNKILTMEDSEAMPGSVQGAELILFRDKESVINLLNTGSKSDISAVVSQLVLRLQTTDYNLLLFQHACVGISNLIVQFLKDIGEDSNEILSDKNAILSGYWLIWANDLNAFSAHLAATLMTVIGIRDKKKKYKYDMVVLKAKRYIDQNYADPDIRLTSIAASENINSSYFSSLFAQEIGESFIEYLTRLRINQAKILLMTTSMRTVDVAFTVGYTDSNYFSRIFRKMTNKSPREYRNKE